jgi:hypothetical protein
MGKLGVSVSGSVPRNPELFADSVPGNWEPAIGSFPGNPGTHSESSQNGR